MTWTKGNVTDVFALVATGVPALYGGYKDFKEGGSNSKAVAVKVLLVFFIVIIMNQDLVPKQSKMPDAGVEEKQSVIEWFGEENGAFAAGLGAIAGVGALGASKLLDDNRTGYKKLANYVAVIALAFSGSIYISGKYQKIGS